MRWTFLHFLMMRSRTRRWRWVGTSCRVSGARRRVSRARRRVSRARRRVSRARSWLYRARGRAVSPRGWIAGRIRSIAWWRRSLLSLSLVKVTRWWGRRLRVRRGRAICNRQYNNSIYQHYSEVNIMWRTLSSRRFTSNGIFCVALSFWPTNHWCRPRDGKRSDHSVPHSLMSNSNSMYTKIWTKTIRQYQHLREIAWRRRFWKTSKHRLIQQIPRTYFVCDVSGTNINSTG